MACQNGSLETVKELLNANADVNLTDQVVCISHNILRRNASMN